MFLAGMPLPPSMAPLIALPAVFLVWALVLAVSIMSMLNLKTPQDQEFIFRKTPAEMQQLQR